MMCLTDWMALQDDDDEQAAELWAADTSFLWNQKEINVRFMNKILAWRNEEGNFISTKEILSIANEWHECGIDAGKNVVPWFINDDSKPSSIRIEFIGKEITLILAIMIITLILGIIDLLLFPSS